MGGKRLVSVPSSTPERLRLCTVRGFDAALRVARLLELCSIEATLPPDTLPQDLRDQADVDVWVRSEDHAQASRRWEEFGQGTIVDRLRSDAAAVRCRHCSYPLLLREDVGRCPECGHPVFVLERDDDVGEADEWTCERCGHRHPPTFDRCWQCEPATRAAAAPPIAPPSPGSAVAPGEGVVFALIATVWCVIAEAGPTMQASRLWAIIAGAAVLSFLAIGWVMRRRQARAADRR